MERIFNTYNSSEAALNLSEAKSEIQDNFYDFLDNVPIIRYMVSPNRPRAKDLPRDEEGKIIVDITKPHILEDMDYFRPSALHYMKYGTYTNLRPNPNPNSEFGKWLIEETRRCYEGYVRPSDGEWITGDYYFFLNYCPMLVSKKAKGSNKATRIESFPDIWDGHYLMYHYLHQARERGEQAAALSSRGRGKSYSGAALLSKRFILGVGKGEESRRRTCFILAADTSKLVAGDQTLDKFQYDIDFIRENMQWPSMRLTDALQKMQWKMGYVDLNTGTKKGTLNSVVGFSIVDEAKVRGSRGDLFLFEEAGSFPKLLDTFNNLIPSVKEGDNVYGQIFLYGTAADKDSDFSSMQEIMYNPEGYGVYGVDNVYDKEGFGKRRFTFFFPEYFNRVGCYDSNGNSDVTKALYEIITERIKVKYNSSDIRTILKTISDRPIVPQEAIMRVRGNFFPITDINNRIAQLDANPSEYDDVYVGKVIFNSENRPEFQPTSDTPIRDFPLKNESTKGAVEIFKLPEKDSSGNVFSNRYIAGLDPIDDDSSDDSSHSLMSLFVLDLWTDSIVCEYTERTSFADDGYEMIRRILLFYNARCLYENNKKGIFSYFSRMNCIYLLEDTPEFLRDRDMIKTTGLGNKSKGYSATKGINEYADKLTRDWLMQPVTIIQTVNKEETETTVYKLYTVRNRAFLRECSLFNPDINVDRIRAFGAVMLSREQHLIYNNGTLKRDSEKIERDYLGNDDFFTRNYDRRKQ